MATESCEACAYYRASHCHYNPPQAWAGDPRIGQSDSSVWPHVEANDWCGQFKTAPAGPPSRKV